jgi:hypothetical protein
LTPYHLHGFHFVFPIKPFSGKDENDVHFALFGSSKKSWNTHTSTLLWLVSSRFN